MYKELRDPKEYLPIIKAMSDDPRRLHKVTVDADKCMGCKRCIHACTYGVYNYNWEENHSVAAYSEECVACLQCMYYCPASAIEVEEAELAFFDPIYDSLRLNEEPGVGAQREEGK